jgi:glutamate-1-semialdehyde 2,1-aminomutase
MGCVPPDKDWLPGVRRVTRDHGALLVLDEVMTGFRVAWGGAQVRYGVEPDLSCFAKVIGGGLPVGAYAGPARLMDQVAPEGPVYQAGTLSGNPLALSGGIATLRVLSRPGMYEHLERTGRAVERILASAAAAAGVPVRVQRVGAMLTVFFTDRDQPVRNLADARATRADRFPAWHRALLDHGVSWPPSNFESAFLTLAHGDEELEILEQASTAAFAALPD